MKKGRPPRTAIHERVAREVEELRDRLGGLPSPEEAEEIWKTIWVHEAHNSTAIEGNTLVLQQVEALLARGETVGGKELKEYLEVKGYANAATWVYQQAQKKTRDPKSPLLTVQEVRHVHREAMSLVWSEAPHPNAYSDEGPGSFRRHDIQRFESGLRPPSFTDVHAQVTDWVRDVNRLRFASGRIIELLAELHAGFERIHPFLDGNGRTGRLLMNLVLVRFGYPPAVIQKRERRLYLKALAKADRGDPGPLGELLARAVLDNLMRFVLPAVAGEVKLLALEALVMKSLSLTALRQAAERGRLRAQRDDRGVWRSSKKWVREYTGSRYASLRQPRTTRARTAVGASARQASGTL